MDNLDHPYMPVYYIVLYHLSDILIIRLPPTTTIVSTVSSIPPTDRPTSGYILLLLFTIFLICTTFISMDNLDYPYIPVYRDNLDN